MERNYAIDYFKFFAIFFVVCIHTAPFYGTDVIGIDGKYIEFITNTFARFGVPFFFLVSGFLFGQKITTNNNPKKYFNKYVFKLVKLFVSWYVFYLIYDSVISILRAVVKGLDIKIAIITYLNSALNLNLLYYGGGLTSHHLWYLTALIWSVIILFIFISVKKLSLLLIFSLFLNFLGLFGQIYSGIFHLSIQTRDAIFFGLFYTTLGCYFAFNYNWLKQKINNTKSSFLISLFLFFSFTQIAERSIAVLMWDGTTGGVDYYISTIPATICLFLIVVKNRHLGKNSILSKIGKNAVGVYVTHTLFISLTFLIFSFLGVEDVKQYFLFHLLFTPIVFTTSYLFYSMLQIFKKKNRQLFDRFFSANLINFENQK